jgi:hypothetical protein
MVIKLNKFIICFEEDKKHDLINKGLKFISQTIIDNKIAYVFLNNIQLQFSKEDNVIFTDKLSF